MKIKIIHIAFIFVLSFQLKAQINLVPNYSFEVYDICPIQHSYLTPSCSFWFTPMSKMTSVPSSLYSLNSWGSSDYFNICSPNNSVQVPQNALGFQYPNAGNAYSGIYLTTTISTSYINFKEYIETTLDQRLVKSREYCVEFYYSIAEYGPSLEYYPIEVGILLTDTVVYRLSGVGTNQPQNIITTPQVTQQLPTIKDTMNWIRVSSSFIAQGRERYLTIGNFQNTDTLLNKTVYVYIDDVKLWYCGPDTTPQPLDSMIIPNIFTPNGDGINDKFDYKNQEQWEFETQIYNRWGELVFDNKSSENWDGTFKGNKVSAGVYFYMIKATAIKNGEIRVYKGTVTVMY